MGTFAYMSPEQMRGEEVDARTDVFAFGALLYEMLTGKLPFPGRSGAEIVASILKDPVRPPSALVAALPEGLDNIVLRALEKDRKLRTESAARAASELRSLAAGTTTGATPVPKPLFKRTGSHRRVWFVAGGATALIAVLAVLVVPRLFPRPSAGLASRPETGPPAVPFGEGKRIAVLPFENLGPAEDDFFAAGMTDEVRSKLIALPGLAVIARGSVTEYKGTTKSPTQIAAELGVQYLLSATVRWQKASGGPSHVRVTPELVEVGSTGAPAVLWQQDFDAVLKDVFRVQTDIATRVAASLQVALGDTERRRISAPPTNNLAAYEAFLRGQEVSSDLTADDSVTLHKAIAGYEQAVALDPNFALAWSQLSRARSDLYSNGVPTPDLASSALTAAKRARELRPDLPEAWLALGDYQVLVKHDAATAHADYHEGLAIAPEHVGLLTASAVAEVTLGRWQEAVTHLREASVLDPRSVLAARRLGFTLLRLRRYREALAVYNHGLELQPANLDLLEQKAMVYLAQGDLIGARAVLAGAPDEVDPATLVAFVANYWDLYWVLNDDQQRVLLRLSPDAFGGDRAVWGLVLAETCSLRGDTHGREHYAEEARRALVAQLAASPEDAQRHSFLGLALAYLGRRPEAVREGRRAVELLPRSRDAYTAPYLEHQLARIYVLTGEYDRAIDQLESLLKTPYYLAPGWLRIDPEFAPLRDNSRFENIGGRAAR
jgi:TolB-like protein/tetratricopeptide (TPR) repeat protein